MGTNGRSGYHRRRKSPRGRFIEFMLAALVVCACVAGGGSIGTPGMPEMSDDTPEKVFLADTASSFDFYQLPDYSGQAYVAVNNNIPFFTADEIEAESYELYNDLDSLGRCTYAVASLCVDTMPAEGEVRGEIGMIKPTGWHTQKYDCVEGKYIYNRCHMIGWQLGAENANEKNLVTGTRYMNVQMLEHEDSVAEYIRTTENHVMYRVTPVFIEDELVCRGLLMEGYSVEDAGEGICFCVFYYNVQPGIKIDYATGDTEEIIS